MANEVSKVVTGNTLKLTTTKDGVTYTTKITDSDGNGIFDKNDARTFGSAGAQSVFTAEVLDKATAGVKADAANNAALGASLMNSNINGFEMPMANYQLNQNSVNKARNLANMFNISSAALTYCNSSNPFVGIFEGLNVMNFAKALCGINFFDHDGASDSGNSAPAAGTTTTGNTTTGASNGTTATGNTTAGNTTAGNTTTGTGNSTNATGNTTAGNTTAGAGNTTTGAGANSPVVEVITNADGTKSTRYLVQPDQKIEDLVRISLKAQGKENPTAEEVKATTVKFMEANKAFSGTKNGNKFIYVGSTVTLDGEVKETVEFDTKEKAEAEWAKRHPAGTRRTEGARQSSSTQTPRAAAPTTPAKATAVAATTSRTAKNVYAEISTKKTELEAKLKKAQNEFESSEGTTRKAKNEEIIRIKNELKRIEELQGSTELKELSKKFEEAKKEYKNAKTDEQSRTACNKMAEIENKMLKIKKEIEEKKPGFVDFMQNIFGNSTLMAASFGK